MTELAPPAKLPPLPNKRRRGKGIFCNKRPCLNKRPLNKSDLFEFRKKNYIFYCEYVCQYTLKYKKYKKSF